MSLAELGCFASHYALWQYCLCHNTPICVLEDDIEIESSFFEALDFLEKEIRGLYYVRLNYSWKHTKTKPTPFKQIHEIIGVYNGIGTQGYVLTPQAATAFIKASRFFHVSVDWLMDAYHLHKIPNLVIKPFAIKDGGLYSSQIQHLERSLSPSLQLMHKIWWRYFPRFYPH